MHAIRRPRFARRRRGLATVELAFALPLLLLFLFAIATLASFGLTRMDIAVEVRYDAWAGKDAPWIPDPRQRYEETTLPVSGCAEVGSILGPQPLLPPDRGLLVARTSREVPIFAATMQSIIPEVHEQHCVLGGCWDYRNIPFPDRRQLHPPLRCCKKYRYIPARRRIDMDGFLRLLPGW